MLTFSLAVVIARIWLVTVPTYSNWYIFYKILNLRYAHVSIDSMADGNVPMHGLSAGIVITVAMFAMGAFID